MRRRGLALGPPGVALLGLALAAAAWTLWTAWAGPETAAARAALAAAFGEGEDLARMPRATFSLLFHLTPCAALGTLGLWFLEGAVVPRWLPRDLRTPHDAAATWVVFAIPCVWVALLVTNLVLWLPASLLGPAGEVGAGLVVLGFLGGNLLGGLVGLLPASWFVSVVFAPRPEREELEG